MPYLFDEKMNSIPINDAVSRRWDKNDHQWKVKSQNAKCKEQVTDQR
jgi:hypothetical protein